MNIPQLILPFTGMFSQILDTPVFMFTSFL
jgi:hypothetical protein